MDTPTVVSSLPAALAAARGVPVLLAGMALALLLALLLGTVLSLWLGELRDNLLARLPCARANPIPLRVRFCGQPSSGLSLADVVLVGPEREERHYRLLPYAMLNLLALVLFGAANTFTPIAHPGDWRVDAGLCAALALLAFITARGTVLLGSADAPTGRIAHRHAPARQHTPSGLSLPGVIGFTAALALVAHSVAALPLRDALGQLLRAAMVMPLVAGIVVTVLEARLFAHAHEQYAFDSRRQLMLRRGAHCLALPFIAVGAAVWALAANWLADGGVSAERVAWLGAGSWLALGAAYVLSTWAHRANNYLAAILGAPGVPIIDNTRAERRRVRERILHLDGIGLAETARRHPLLPCIVVGQTVVGALQLIAVLCSGGPLVSP